MATLVATAVGVVPLLLGLHVKTTSGLLLYLGILVVVGFVAGALLSRRRSASGAMLVSIVTAVLLAVALLTIGDEDILTILLAPPVAFTPLLIGTAIGYRVCHRDGAICS